MKKVIRSGMWCLGAVFCCVLMAGWGSAALAASDSGNASTPKAQTAADDLTFMDDEEEGTTIQVADPLILWNRGMYHFNDKLYFWVLKPVARGYGAVIPKVGRQGVSNFFYNIGMPVRLAGCLLQGKMKNAGCELGRFGLNSTLGVLGFGNPARKYAALNPDAEDIGQAFGKWGIGNGVYIVWPIFGPSTLRDTVGLVGDHFLDPVTYVEPTEASMGIKAEDTVNGTSLRIGEYESLKNAAVDPYTAFRDAYVQYRAKKIEK